MLVVKGFLSLRITRNFASSKGLNKLVSISVLRLDERDIHSTCIDFVSNSLEGVGNYLYMI